MQIIENLRGAMLVASTTIAAGIGTVLKLVPADIGKLASLLGVVLTAVLIFVHISRELRERKKAELETELLRRKLRDDAPD